LGEQDGVCEVQIKVTDTGIGISAEQQALLFQSFQQAEGTTARKFGGTGLGLSISRSIVEMMGGRIWIQSELLKGATFSFVVKLKKGENQGRIADYIKLDNVRILVADHDPGMLEYYKKTAEGLGAYCDTALSGGDIHQMIERNDPYSIYFLDWEMPDTDIMQLARSLKEIGGERGNIVVLTISTIDWNKIEKLFYSWHPFQRSPKAKAQSRPKAHK
jgi:CheY-like chemotaxis protein